MSPSPLTSLSPICLLLLLMTASCGGSGGSGSSGEEESWDLLIGDAPIEGLLALSGRVEDLRLQSEDGTESERLLSEPIALEFLGLRDRSAFLSRASAPASRGWSKVVVRFEEGSFVALDRAGSQVPMNVVSHELVVDLPQRSQAGRVTVRVDLDIERSLKGTVDQPPLEFRPVGSAELHTEGSLPLRPVEAIFVSGNENTLRTRSTSGRSTTMEVDLTGDTILLGNTGQPVDRRDQWLSELVTEDSVLQIHGSWRPDGSIEASRVESLPTDFEALEVEGLLLSLSDSIIDLLLQEILLGHDTVEAFLADLPDPARLPIRLDDATLIFDVDGQTITPDDLQPPQRIRTRFRIVDDVALAQCISVVTVPEPIEAYVHAIDGVPTSIVAHAREDTPAVLAGLIESSDTDVVVDLTTTDFRLEGSDIAVGPRDLVPGMRIELQGGITGPSSSPTVHCQRCTIRRGAAIGCVVDAESGAREFQMRVLHRYDPFLKNDVGGLLEVALLPGARFSGEVDSERAFFELWAGLPNDETLRTEVHGFASPSPDRVLASEIIVHVRPILTGPIELWPPNHEMETIGLTCDLDLRDDLGQPLFNFEITGITQDEPVNGKGDGNTAPDAEGVGEDVVRIRSERAGGENGRVYEVQFTASNIHDEQVTGSVIVSVPHSQNGDAAIDDGQVYDSTSDG